MPDETESAPDRPAPSLSWPDDNRERLIMLACGFGVLYQAIRYYATLPLVTYFLTRPLRALAIRSDTLAIVIGGSYARVGKDPAWAVFLLGMFAVGWLDPLRYLAGRRYGDTAARLLFGQYPKTIDRVERFTAKYGAWALTLGWFTPIPMMLIDLAAGTSGMRFRKFLAFDLLGVALYTGLLFGLGYGIGQPAVDLTKKIGHYGLYVTIGVIVVVVIGSVVKAMRQQRRA